MQGRLEWCKGLHTCLVHGPFFFLWAKQKSVMGQSWPVGPLLKKPLIRIDFSRACMSTAQLLVFYFANFYMMLKSHCSQKKIGKDCKHSKSYPNFNRADIISTTTPKSIDFFLEIPAYQQNMFPTSFTFHLKGKTCEMKLN